MHHDGALVYDPAMSTVQEPLATAEPVKPSRRTLKWWIIGAAALIVVAAIAVTIVIVNVRANDAREQALLAKGFENCVVLQKSLPSATTDAAATKACTNIVAKEGDAKFAKQWGNLSDAQLVQMANDLLGN